MYRLMNYLTIRPCFAKKATAYLVMDLCSSCLVYGQSSFNLPCLVRSNYTSIRNNKQEKPQSIIFIA